MYSINNVEYYKIYDAKNNEIIKYLYSKDELVNFIAHCYKYTYYDEIYYNNKRYVWSRIDNSFISNCAVALKELNNPYRYIIYDNFNRIINVHNLKKDALKYFNSMVRNKDFPWNIGDRFLNNVNKKRKKYSKYHDYSDNYEYRKDPVPYTNKWRGGPHQRGPRTAKIIRMYKNPEYKDFNRGSASMIPTWWDDRRRTVQRSWKSQSKFRHQWEKNSVKNFL